MISKDTLKKKIRKIGRQFDDGVLIPNWGFRNPNFIYLLGSDIDYSIAYIDNSGLKIFTTMLNQSLCNKEYGEIAEVIVFKSIREVIQKTSRNCAVDYSHAPYYIYRKIKGHRNAGEVLTAIREVKDDYEIETMRTARRKTVKMLDKIDVCGNEDRIYRNMLVAIAGMGCAAAFDPIVANSSNARFPHYKPGKGRVTDYVLIDAGIRYMNYNSDITRCIGNVPKEYATLKEIVMEICDFAYSGTEINEFLENVDNVLARYKIPTMPHSIGHGIGIEVHELPHLRKNRSKNILKENSVITIEPGIYNRNGLRYEDMFVIGKKKARII
ncbi:MAG: M24 family metallopeptidase [Candidatus Micrarchaeia archaeon]